MELYLSWNAGHIGQRDISDRRLRTFSQNGLIHLEPLSLFRRKVWTGRMKNSEQIKSECRRTDILNSFQAFGMKSAAFFGQILLCYLMIGVFERDALFFSFDDNEGDGRTVSLERILEGSLKLFLGHGRWGTMHADFEVKLCSPELAQSNGQ